MSYRIKELADLAGVTVRSLHYYDEIDLLKPSQVKRNGYRLYGEEELLKLQQILFFKELDFPLKEIHGILSAENFDLREALLDQKQLLKIKEKRLRALIRTIDMTMNKITNNTNMKDQNLYKDFSTKEVDQYAAEAKKRWGQTQAYKQSQQRVAKMGKAGLAKVMKRNDELLEQIAQAMKNNLAPESKEVQKLITQHYEGLRAFYEPNLEIYQGLAEMYISDERFKAYYEKVAQGLAQYMHDAMLINIHILF